MDALGPALGRWGDSENEPTDREFESGQWPSGTMDVDDLDDCGPMDVSETEQPKDPSKRKKDAIIEGNGDCGRIAPGFQGGYRVYAFPST